MAFDVVSKRADMLRQLRNKAADASVAAKDLIDAAADGGSMEDLADAYDKLFNLVVGDAYAAFTIVAVLHEVEGEMEEDSGTV